MSPALLILSIESLGACMREEQKRISFSFKKKKKFFTSSYVLNHCDKTFSLVFLGQCY